MKLTSNAFISFKPYRDHQVTFDLTADAAHRVDYKSGRNARLGREHSSIRARKVARICSLAQPFAAMRDRARKVQLVEHVAL